MAFKFPFTNYHELNLTWVLDQLKKLFEESAENVTTIQNYDGRLAAVETELPSVSETASEASRAAAAAGTLAQTAKATADTAQENAVQAQSLAGTARQEAQTAQEAADAATQAAQQAQATAQNFDGRITQAQNNAASALEASRSFENRVQAAITTANNAAQTATNAQGIATRADQNAGTALDKIGNLSALDTTAKQNLVAAINEVFETGGGGGDCSDCAPLIINSASGDIATFDDGADNKQIRKIVATIDPQQSGSGDPTPDNVRPISGWTGCTISHSGADTTDPDTLPISWETEAGAVYGGTLTLNEDGSGMLIRKGRYIVLTPESVNNDTTAWDRNASAGYRLKFLVATNVAKVGTALCSHLITTADGSTVGTNIGVTSALLNNESAGVRVYIYIAGCNTKASTIQYIQEQYNNGTPIQFVFNISEANWTTYHLSADEVRKLYSYYGTNNFWCNTGDVEITYPADTKLYIDSKIAELQALILEN